MPNRLLKESICESEEIDRLTWFQEVLFYRLIVKCDDYGILDARPKILKAKLFPLKDVAESHLTSALNALSTAGLVRLYESEGRPYLQLITWHVHQQIRAKKSKYPTPDINCNQMISNDIKCSRNPIQSNPNQNPNPNPIIYEREGGNPFRPDINDVREYIAVKGFHFTAEEFMEYYDSVDWMASGGRPITNWMAKCPTFERNWKRDQERHQQRKGPATATIPVPDYIRDQTRREDQIDFDSLPGGDDDDNKKDD